MKKLLFPFTLSVLCSVLPLNARPVPDEPVSMATLLREESDFSRLPLRRTWTTHLDSSCDKTGGNKDAQQFISWEGETALMADLPGPGALVRLWSTSVSKIGKNLTSNQAGILKIYLDDNPTPVINIAVAELFKGGFPPFARPLTATNGSTCISYLPIPYAKHCRITIDKPVSEFFYQINSIRFPEGTKVRPFALPLAPEDEKALQLANEKWMLPVKTASVDPAAPGNAALTIKAGDTAELPAIAGPGTVVNLTLAAPTVSDSGLRKLVLRAWFDGHKTPDIEAPVADFFGNAYGHKVFESLFFSQNGAGEMTFRLPMPFFKEALFGIENGNTQPVTVNVAFATRLGLIPKESLYLRADFNEEITVKGKAHPWVHEVGQSGHFVGVVQVMHCGRTLSYCEGDDQVRVDDEKFIPSKFPTVLAPSNGTGTEDFFNSSWYFSEGEKARELNGCLVKQMFGRIDAFRFFLNDAPVFQRSIDAQIEHGGLNDTEKEYYSSVAFWYGTGERVPIAPMPAAATLGFSKIVFWNDPTVIEGESLVGVAKATGGAIHDQERTGLQNVWSNDHELSWTGGKTGDKLTLPFTVPKAGDYMVLLLHTRGPRFGYFTFAVNDAPIGNNMDAYSDELSNCGPDGIGIVTLPAGTSKLTVTLSGKNSHSTGTDFGLDAITLRPAPKPKVPLKK